MADAEISLVASLIAEAGPFIETFAKDVPKAVEEGVNRAQDALNKLGDSVNTLFAENADALRGHGKRSGEEFSRGLKEATEGHTELKQHVEKQGEEAEAQGREAGERTGQAFGEGLSLLVGAYASQFLDKIVESFKEATDSAEELMTRSRQFGDSIEITQELSDAFAGVGVSADDASRSIITMQRHIASAASTDRRTGKKNDIFSRAGLDVQQMEKQSGSQNIVEVADALSTLKESTQKDVMAQLGLGLAGVKMVAALNEGGDAIKNNMKAAKDLGETMETSTVKAFADLKDAMTSAGETAKVFYASFLAPITNTVKSVVQEIQQVQAAFERLSGNEKLSIVFAAMGSAVLLAEGAFASLRGIIGGIIGQEAFTAVLTFGRLLGVLAAIVSVLAIAFVNNFGDIKVMLQTMGGSVSSTFSRFHDAFKEISADVETTVGPSIKRLSDFLGNLLNDWVNTINGMNTDPWDAVKVAVHDVAVVLSYVIDWITKFAQWLRDINPQIVAVASGIKDHLLPSIVALGLAAAFTFALFNAGAVLTGVKAIISFLESMLTIVPRVVTVIRTLMLTFSAAFAEGGIAGVIGTIGAAIGGLLTPIGWISVGLLVVAGVIVAVIANWDKLKDVFQIAGAVIKHVLDDMYDGWEKFLGALAEVTNYIGFLDILKGSLSAISGVITGIGNAWTEANAKQAAYEEARRKQLAHDSGRDQPAPTMTDLDGNPLDPTNRFSAARTKLHSNQYGGFADQESRKIDAQHRAEDLQKTLDASASARNARMASGSRALAFGALSDPKLVAVPTEQWKKDGMVALDNQIKGHQAELDREDAANKEKERQRRSLLDAEGKAKKSHADTHENSDALKAIKEELYSYQEMLKYTGVLLEDLSIKQDSIGKIDTAAKLALSQQYLNEQIHLTNIEAQQQFTLAERNRIAEAKANALIGHYAPGLTKEQKIAQDDADKAAAHGYRDAATAATLAGKRDENKIPKLQRDRDQEALTFDAERAGNVELTYEQRIAAVNDEIAQTKKQEIVSTGALENRNAAVAKLEQDKLNIIREQRKLAEDIRNSQDTIATANIKANKDRRDAKPLDPHDANAENKRAIADASDEVAIAEIKKYADARALAEIEVTKAEAESAAAAHAGSAELAKVTEQTVKYNAALAALTGSSTALALAQANLDTTNKAEDANAKSLTLSLDKMAKQVAGPLYDAIVSIQHGMNPLQALFEELFTKSKSFNDIMIILGKVVDQVARIFDAMRPVIDFLLGMLVGIVNVFLSLYNVIVTLLNVFGLGIEKIKLVTDSLTAMNNAVVPVLQIIHDVPTINQYNANDMNNLHAQTNPQSDLLSGFDKMSSKLGEIAGTLLAIYAITRIIAAYEAAKGAGGLLGAFKSVWNQITGGGNSSQIGPDTYGTPADTSGANNWGFGTGPYGTGDPAGITPDVGADIVGGNSAPLEQNTAAITTQSQLIADQTTATQQTNAAVQSLTTQAQNTLSADGKSQMVDAYPNSTLAQSVGSGSNAPTDTSTGTTSGSAARGVGNIGTAVASIAAVGALVASAKGGLTSFAETLTNQGELSTLLKGGASILGESSALGGALGKLGGKLGGISAGVAMAGNVIGGMLNKGMGGNATDAQLLGNIGGTVGTIFGGPLGAAIGSIAGEVLGGMFGPRAPTANNAPDQVGAQINGEDYGQAIANLQGSGLNGTAQMTANNAQYSAQNGDQFLKTISDYIAGGGSALDASLKSEFSGATGIIGGKNGILDLANGVNEQWQQLVNDANKAMTEISQAHATAMNNMMSSTANMVAGASQINLAGLYGNGASIVPGGNAAVNSNMVASTKSISDVSAPVVNITIGAIHGTDPATIQAALQPTIDNLGRVMLASSRTQAFMTGRI
jgi:hypothetical protein